MSGTVPRPHRPAFTVFTPGDARKLSTWSNVPYLFTRALERYGYQVVHVDIGQDKPLRAVYDLAIVVLRALRLTRNSHNYFRSRLHRWITERRIARALQRHPHNENLFITFSFSGHRFNKPYALFCDMTYAKSIGYFNDRAPDRTELRTIRHEEENLRHAKLVISLFPELAEELRAEHGDRVKYYGNVVNIEEPEVDTRQLLRKGEDGIELVFIGKAHYRQGLKLLLEAMPLLNEGRARPVTLHVIGHTRLQMMGPVPEHVEFHGYLDKGDPVERQRYYDILRRAYLFVNPNVKWGAFSASLEAMFLYTPVVLFPYPEFTRTFGDDGEVGHFLRNEDPAELADAIRGLIDDRGSWLRKAAHAHEVVKDFTWDRYVARYLADLGLPAGERP